MYDLQMWWIETSENDIRKNISKIKEYGAVDLQLMGAAMEIPTRNGEIVVSSGMEKAIGFYLLGKIARAISAWEDGSVPSEDTLYDITFYSMMLRRVRETGRWP